MEILTFAEAEQRHPGSYLEIAADPAAGENGLLVHAWKNQDSYSRQILEDRIATYILKKECMWQSPEIPV